MPPCSTSRGDYTFGTAIGGHTVQQPCEKIAEGRLFGFAYLLCRESGEWAATVNTSQCAYTSTVTDTLHKFAAMNMTFTPRTLMESARQFLNFTADPAVFKDEMDLVYFSHAVENYLPYLVSETHDSKTFWRFTVRSLPNLLCVSERFTQPLSDEFNLQYTFKFKNIKNTLKRKERTKIVSFKIHFN